MTRHFERLGRLIGALQTLEVALRTYLLTVDEHPNDHKPSVDYIHLVKGDEVDKDAMTNYDSLCALVKKFNKSIRSHSDTELEISLEVVSIRDLIAHGRVLSLNQDTENLRIFKFTDPSKSPNGKPKVSDAVVFNDDWYNQNGTLIDEQNEKVLIAIGKYAPVKGVKVLRKLGDVVVTIKEYS